MIYNGLNESSLINAVLRSCNREMTQKRCVTPHYELFINVAAISVR